MQIDSFMELPKDKRPPESIWDDPDELDRWFDRVFSTGGKSNIELLVVDEVE